MKVRDVMTTQVVTVTPDTPVSEVAAIMLAQRVSGLPVVDAEGRLRGIVSEGDLIRRAEIGTDRRRRSWWLALLSDEEDEAREYVKTHGRLARDVMTRPVITIGPDTDLADVAMLLEKHRVKRLPVVDDDGALLGVVSRADLLRALATVAPVEPADSARSDREIRERLVAHIAEQPWAESAMVNVIVSDGVVHLWGVVDGEEQREAMIVAARSIPGVRDVEDHLTLSLPT